MITNKPAPDEFKNLSVQYLAQSVDLLLKTEMALTQGDWGADEVLEEEWENRQGILGNSLIMLFLSIENYFKYRICKVDPLLLIAGEPSRWGLSKGNKNFEDLFIHQFDDLLVIYQEITEEGIDLGVKQRLNELRKKRNKYTHGLHRAILNPKYIIESTAIYLTSLWEENWTRDFKSAMLTEPLYGLTNEEEEQMMLLSYFKIFEKYLTANELRKLIGMPSTGRRYLCPYCKNCSIESGITVNPNYALLVPNKAESETINCWLCECLIDVKRSSCILTECHGNVIYAKDTHYEHTSNCCLTCGSAQNR
ncbi:hypothetical protein [Cobetia sp. 29-18-1]|uniref:hypothetical protein n=1 Tax=Cobetia sp. 29-18-1 TaxID=3040018 RepID=UPI00244A33B8|nr:hypothetical protein [Cobetia sp. 29-18-1]MDH2299484.1 hypothetical protein [Cobetia sp. 29-18-1]